ncbi:MAG: FG-GAP-like repeat-containing protein [Bacteroidota bacterium]
MKQILFILLCLMVLAATGQPYPTAHTLAKIEGFSITGDTLLNPWAGSMNKPQFSSVDLDGDGQDELVIFDREADIFMPYKHLGGTEYAYAPEFEASFAACDCDGWALLEDYNCDGLPDVFCGSPAGANVQIYRHVQGGAPFSQFVLETPFLQTDYKDATNTRTALFSLNIDVPAIVDVDNDGDMDFFTFDILLNYIGWHKNMAQERFGRCDTMFLELETQCWGHFSESNFDNTAFIRDHNNFFCPLGNIDTTNCLPRSGKKKIAGDPESGGLHAGSTLLILDLDGDKVKEILIGDVEFDEIYALHNCGRPDYAYMDSVETLYPRSDTSVDVPFFPATFFVDIDQDGIRDLIAAPNDETNGDNYNAVAYYRNEGLDSIPDFKFQGKGFLQETHFDFGTRSSPTFLDYNQDGLQDILVGNFGYFNQATRSLDLSGLALLENTGLPGCPQYTLVDDDYLNIISTFRYPNLFTITPTAGDLDGDGDDDLLLGCEEGTLYYFRNIAMPGQVANFRFVSSNFANLDVGMNSAPFLYDIDNDNDLDLFIGNSRGEITFLRNVGAPNNPTFSKISETWGNITVPDFNPLDGSFNGNVKPFLLDLDEDNEPELLAGSLTGDVWIYENVTNALNDTLRPSGKLLNRNFGAYAAVAAARIDSTGDFTFLLGDTRGGLQLYNTLPTSRKCDSLLATSIQGPVRDIDVLIYPNPVKDLLQIEVPTAQMWRYTLVNSMGQTIREGSVSKEKTEIDLQGIGSGLFWIKVEVEGQRTAQAILVE